MIPEDGIIIQHNLLKQFNEFIRKVSRHECFDSHRDIFRILCLTKRRLDNLVDKLTTVAVLWVEDNLPEVWITTSDEVACLTLEEGVLIANLKTYSNIAKGHYVRVRVNSVTILVRHLGLLK